MDKLELRLTFKEREDFKKPFKALGREILGSDYYHCEVRIGEELYTSYINSFEFLKHVNLHKSIFHSLSIRSKLNLPIFNKSSKKPNIKTKHSKSFFFRVSIVFGIFNFISCVLSLRKAIYENNEYKKIFEDKKQRFLLFKRKTNS